MSDEASLPARGINSGFFSERCGKKRRPECACLLSLHTLTSVCEIKTSTMPLLLTILANAIHFSSELMLFDVLRSQYRPFTCARASGESSKVCNLVCGGSVQWTKLIDGVFSRLKKTTKKQTPALNHPQGGLRVIWFAAGISEKQALATAWDVLVDHSYT